MVESGFCHHAPFEYEYRCTEYEYEFPDEQSTVGTIHILSIGVTENW